MENGCPFLQTEKRQGICEKISKYFTRIYLQHFEVLKIKESTRNMVGCNYNLLAFPSKF